ncbi:1980_t:CDS:2, partial [Acaulospora colombiana]
HKDSISTEGSENQSTDALSLIIKSVQPPPIGNKDAKNEGHIRKLLSYKVEQYFYAHLSSQLPEEAKVATYYSPVDQQGVEQPVQLVIEDLSASFPNPAHRNMNSEDTKVVLKWLANLHGTFWGFHRRPEVQESLVSPPLGYEGNQVSGVWGQGTYWYLDTRQEELRNTDQDEYGWLLKWANKVAATMKQEEERWGTLIHGDVKGANIVFSAGSGQSRSCALYDFQYTGIGLVTRDIVVLFAKSVQAELIQGIEQEKELLHVYHSELLRKIASRRNDGQATGNSPNDEFGEYKFETLWRHWELAIVDWCRFMAGWGFWGNDGWVKGRAREIVSRWDEHTFNS